MDSADMLSDNLQSTTYDTLPYDDPLPPLDTPESTALASRIGSKLYPFPESSQAKRKRPDDEDQDESVQADSEDVINTDNDIRSNAIYLRGSPISSLPTARVFAYCKHFRAQPIGLEWVDDTSCVLVFDSTAAAQTAFTNLQRPADAEEGDDVVAHSVPAICWPPEERIGQTLGASERMKEPLLMRWATRFDVKKKRAKEESEFYRKYGENAGKETYEESRERPVKRHRRPSITDDEKKKALDQELDSFLAAEDEEVVEDTEPPSKMRSDYIGSDGRTVLAEPDQAPIVVDLASRLSKPTRRERGSQGRRKEANPRHTRPKKTTAELDAELEAFLNERE